MMSRLMISSLENPLALQEEIALVKFKVDLLGHFWPSKELMQRTDLLEKTQMLGKIEGRRRRGQQKMRWLDGITS